MNFQSAVLGIHRPFVMGIVEQRRILAETARILANPPGRGTPANNQKKPEPAVASGTITRAQFDAMNPQNRAAFIRNKGRVVDPQSARP